MKVQQSVTRYVPTYVNAEGMRTLVGSAQGRNTYATPNEAQAWIDAVLANTPESVVTQLWGPNPRIEVRPCECWPGHHDPIGVWFD